jgi:dUTP pyrophosphatase
MIVERNMSIARFTRVSEAQYAEAMGERERMALSEIPLPSRATAGSAGYDFVSPAEVTVPAGGSALIPTGIRAEMENGWVLMLFPRSSLGFRYGLRLSNTVGVIDSDYAFAENEGHIMVKLSNPLDRPVAISRGERFCQGVFLPYGTAEEEGHFTERTGGFGSTGSH